MSRNNYSSTGPNAVLFLFSPRLDGQSYAKWFSKSFYENRHNSRMSFSKFAKMGLNWSKYSWRSAECGCQRWGELLGICANEMRRGGCWGCPVRSQLAPPVRPDCRPLSDHDPDLMTDTAYAGGLMLNSRRGTAAQSKQTLGFTYISRV